MRNDFYFRWSENGAFDQKFVHGKNMAVTLTIFHIGVMKNCSGVCSDDIISISDPKYRVVIVSKSYFGLK